MKTLIMQMATKLKNNNQQQKQAVNSNHVQLVSDYI